MLKNNFLNYILLIIIVFFFYFYNVGSYDLWAPDEPRYAEVAREMLVLNDYILPHINGHIYYQKPPLFFWEIIAVSKIFNIPINSVSARLPSIILSLLTILLVYYYGKKYFGKFTGFLSALILAVTAEYFWAGTRAQIDNSLVFFTTFSGFLLYEGSKQNNGSKINYKFLLAFILMGLGTLAKGPVSLFSLIIFLIYFIKKNGIKKIFKLKIFRYFVIYLFVVGLWLVPVLKIGGKKYLNKTVLKQTIGRTVNSHSHKKPFYYYIKNFPGQAMPYFIFFIVFLIYGIKNKKFKNNDFLFFNLIWFLGIFIIFSLISGKRELYILQLYPSFALITGYFFYEIYKSKIKNKLILIPSFILSILFLIIPVVLLIVTKNKFSNYYIYGKELAVIFFIFGILLLLLTFLKKKLIIFFNIFLLIFVLGLYAKGRVFPKLNKIKSYRFISEDIISLSKKNIDVYFYGSRGLGGGYFFYSEMFFKEINTKKQLINVLDKNKKIYIVIEKKKFDSISDKNWKTNIMYKKKVGHSMKIIVSIEKSEEDFKE